MSTPIKLGIASCIVAGVTAYMAYVGMARSWQYYLTVDECVAAAPSLVKQRVRVNGKVAIDSLDIAAGRHQATFRLRGTEEDLPVICAGSLPDNLAEDMEVVVEGHLDETGSLQGDKVMTRCASKYVNEPGIESGTFSASRDQAANKGRQR